MASRDGRRVKVAETASVASRNRSQLLRIFESQLHTGTFKVLNIFLICLDNFLVIAYVATSTLLLILCFFLIRLNLLVQNSCDLLRYKPKVNCCFIICVIFYSCSFYRIRLQNINGMTGNLKPHRITSINIQTSKYYQKLFKYSPHPDSEGQLSLPSLFGHKNKPHFVTWPRGLQLEINLTREPRRKWVSCTVSRCDDDDRRRHM